MCCSLKAKQTIGADTNQRKVGSSHIFWHHAHKQHWLKYNSSLLLSQSIIKILRKKVNEENGKNLLLIFFNIYTIKQCGEFMRMTYKERSFPLQCNVLIMLSHFLRTSNRLRSLKDYKHNFFKKSASKPISSKSCHVCLSVCYFAFFVSVLPSAHAKRLVVFSMQVLFFKILVPKDKN